MDNLKATLANQEAELKQKNENADKLIHVVGVETEKVSKEKAIADEEEAKVEIINEVGRQAWLPSATAHGSAGPGLPRALSTAPAPRKTCGPSAPTHKAPAQRRAVLEKCPSQAGLLRAQCPGHGGGIARSW